MLAEFLNANLYAFLVVFARLGAALMLLPPFGDIFVLRRTRLVLALALSLLVTPLAAPQLPAEPGSPLAVMLVLGGEIAVGLFIGGLARLLFSALHTASFVVANQTGLGAAMAFAPNQGDQGVMVSQFFTLMGLTLLFATDLHQKLLLTLVDSYDALPPGGLPPAGDFAEQAIDFIAGAFVVALQVATPVLLAGLLLSISLGLIARLMPQIQVFFIALPLQIMLGFSVLMVSLSAMMLWYFEFFEENIDKLIGAG
ncbi:MAG: flagellar biosynthetic protein FliR [Alphaproteobacteria bacterium]